MGVSCDPKDAEPWKLYNKRDGENILEKSVEGNCDSLIYCGFFLVPESKYSAYSENLVVWLY